MKIADVSFRHFGGSGPLSIYWYEGPYGDAVESIEGLGVAWYAQTGELLGVEFDDVNFKKDKQELLFKSGHRVSITVKNGKVKTQLVRNKKAA